jgi:1-acyl-sn-glycerol-3-phosphate acyltransferase
MAKVGNTVFVDRKRHKSAEQRDLIQSRFQGQSAESLILFPEGTSGDGNRVLPFKSALFAVAGIQAANGAPLSVQPVSIAYTYLDGMPIGRGWRPYFAWYGDMDLAPHIWVVAGLGRATVEVEFHPPVKIDMFDSRKALAEHCQSVVRAGVTAANSHRPVQPRVGPTPGELSAGGSLEGEPVIAGNSSEITATIASAAGDL